jgi:Xaa-Pro aminopeptidase
VSPVLFLKAKKNSVEAAGMMKAHVKDAVALCDFLSQLDDEVPRGIYWDELKASDALLQYRLQQEGSRGASFETIAGFGPNGAIIHYGPSNETNAAITTGSLFLLDSGGQFLDGTTDVTRTMHYGTPTTAQKVN